MRDARAVIDMRSALSSPAALEGEVGTPKASFAKMMLCVYVNAGEEAGQPREVLQRA
jgi:hypothetical protein